MSQEIKPDYAEAEKLAEYINKPIFESGLANLARAFLDSMKRWEMARTTLPKIKMQEEIDRLSVDRDKYRDLVDGLIDARDKEKDGARRLRICLDKALELLSDDGRNEVNAVISKITMENR